MSSAHRECGSSAISAAFDVAHAEGRCALITYLTLGYPSPADTLKLVPALQAAGSDIIELGVPFSDPIADGPIIQRASHLALQAGVTPRDCLELATEVRGSGVTVPLVLMGYYNPIHSYGVEAFVQDSSSAGIDGFIVPDLPLEEAALLRRACQERGLAVVFLVAPTSSEARIAQIAHATQGFLYVVSRLGTTGTSRSPGDELSSQLETVRRYATTPVAVGFGISSLEQARALATQVDGIVVGSAVVKRAQEGADALLDYVSSLRSALAT